MVSLRQSWCQFTRDFGKALISSECHLTELRKKKVFASLLPRSRSSSHHPTSLRFVKATHGNNFDTIPTKTGFDAVNATVPTYEF